MRAETSAASPAEQRALALVWPQVEESFAEGDGVLREQVAA